MVGLVAQTENALHLQPHTPHHFESAESHGVETVASILSILWCNVCIGTFVDFDASVWKGAIDGSMGIGTAKEVKQIIGIAALKT